MILFRGWLKKGLLPDENAKGEPFWALMEIDEGTVTGSYCTVAPGQIPLFYSKNMADTYLSLRYDKNKLVVRGISQYQLRILLGLAEETCQKIGCYFPIPFATSQDFGFLSSNSCRT